MLTDYLGLTQTKAESLSTKLNFQELYSVTNTQHRIPTFVICNIIICSMCVTYIYVTYECHIVRMLTSSRRPSLCGLLPSPETGSPSSVH